MSLFKNFPKNSQNAMASCMICSEELEDFVFDVDPQYSLIENHFIFSIWASECQLRDYVASSPPHTLLLLEKVSTPGRTLQY